MRLLAVLFCFGLVQADIYSCGGYVRSKAPIDYSKIQIKLFSPEGHLKQEEDVNAQTGYYMMPVYNKGQYSLRVSAPFGWHFEPQSIDIKIDGKTDSCSKNEDINFSLAGFNIAGVVESGSGSGPSGLPLRLLSNGQEIATTVTAEGGRYSFRAPPGNYEVSTGSDSSACIALGKATVIVKDAPVTVVPSLKISGYQLNVGVSNKEAPVEGVSLELYSSNNPGLPGCKAVTNVPQGAMGAKFVCPLPKTNAAGQTVVSCVPTGDYFIVAVYNKDGVAFEFTPAVVPFKMNNEQTKVSTSVSGFSSRGRVELAGKGMAGVDVYSEGKKIATSGADGSFVLTGLKEGRLVLTAKADHTEFSFVHADLRLPFPRIPAVTVTSFELCGSIEHSSDGVEESLTVFKKGGTETDGSPIRAGSDGTFCQMLSPTQYIISPSSASSSLTPRKLEVDLSQGPRRDLKFTHFKTDVEIRVDCIGACEPLQIQLYLGDSAIQTVRGTDVLVLKDISPGKYTARIVDGGRICWASVALPVEVERARPAPIHFEQTGFRANIILSHEAHIKWSHLEKELHGELSATSGRNTFCVPVQGRYQLSISSCRAFDNPTLEVQVPSDTVHEATALDAVVKGSVGAKEKAEIKVLVRSVAGQRVVDVVDGMFTFRELLSATGEIVLVPQSPSHLFEPASASFLFSGDCIESAAQFYAHKGIFLDGQISPAVEGVSIVAQHKDDPNVKFEAVTDKSGKYRVGPVRRTEDLSISASKEGYAFSDVGGKTGQMNSVRLSKLSVAVSELGGDDYYSGRLDGVLLSVVGGRNYRSNSMIDKSGSINFVGLSPGDYFLRPILQEYKFEPSQTTVVVREGEHQQVELKGRRVAYSAFGRVREMSGAAVGDAVVEALATECDHHQSEATTEKDGAFRIRGLKPGCIYKVSMKSGPDGSPAPHCFPSQFTVKMTADHVQDLEMVVAPSDEGFELLVALETTAMTVQPQSVRVTLYRGDQVVSSQSVVHPVRVLSLSNLTRDGSEYSIRVDPERPAQLFHSQEIPFVADRPVRTLQIPLSASKKHSEVEISFTSLMSLPFFGLLALALFNQQKTLELLDTVRDRVRGSRSVSPGGRLGKSKRS